MKNGKTIAFVALMLLLAAALSAYILHGGNSLYRLTIAGGLADIEHLDESTVEQMGIVQDRRLTEISGIDLAIAAYPNALWVHNDSGNPADLFLVSLEGKTLATCKLRGAVNRDWEDICVCRVDGKSYVCVADVGDNTGIRKNVQLYLFEEPQILPMADDASAIDLVIEDVITVEFEYEDGPKNCEAIAFDAEDRAFYLCEKRLDRGRSIGAAGIYRLRWTGEDAVQISGRAERIADIADQHVTGMDIDGNALITQNYVSASLIERMPDTDWGTTLASAKPRTILLPIQRQSEAICFSIDGQHVYTSSEFYHSAIYKIDLRRE